MAKSCFASNLGSSRGAAPERSPQRELWVSRAPNQQAPAGATDATGFCRPIRGLLILPPDPTAHAVGYFLPRLRRLTPVPRRRGGFPAVQPRRLERRSSTRHPRWRTSRSVLDCGSPLPVLHNPHPSKAKRPPTPRGRPQRQRRSAPPPHSRTLARQFSLRCPSREAASDRSPQRELWVSRAPNQQAPAGATDATDFCRPSEAHSFSILNPRLTPWANFCRALGADQPAVLLNSRRNFNFPHRSGACGGFWRRCREASRPVR